MERVLEFLKMFKLGGKYSIPARSLRPELWLVDVVIMAMFWDRHLPQTLFPENNAGVVENKGLPVVEPAPLS
jgi:hypothetical protein